MLLQIKQAVATVVEDAQTPGTCLDTDSLTAFESRYDSILAHGFAINPLPPQPTGTRRKPKQFKPKNLLDRLQTHKPQVLAFMYDFRVPFDNN